jgi:large subunit ribosomal protein L29
MKIKDIRRLNTKQREARLVQTRKDLMDTKSMLSAGGSIDNPGKIKYLRRAIARLLTVKKEEEAEA